jgi:hypothetical protein
LPSISSSYDKRGKEIYENYGNNPLYPLYFYREVEAKTFFLHSGIWISIVLWISTFEYRSVGLGYVGWWAQTIFLLLMGD